MLKNERLEIMEMWSWLICNDIATEDELTLITDMNGYNIHVLNDVFYYRTGYHDREEWWKEETKWQTKK